MIAYNLDDSAIYDGANNTDATTVGIPNDVHYLEVEIYADLKDEYCELDDYQVDLFAFFLDSTGRLPNNAYVMFYNNSYLYEVPEDPKKEYYINKRLIWGFPDAISEAYYLGLELIPKEIESIVFVCSLYDAQTLKYDFEKCNYIRIRAGNSSLGNKEGRIDSEVEKKATLAQWEINRNLKNVSVLNLATLRRTNNGWELNRNEGPLHDTIIEICEKYGADI